MDNVGQIYECVPGVAAGADDLPVGFEDTVGEIGLAQVLPNILDRVEFGTVGRQRHEHDIFRDLQCFRAMPPRLIQQHGGNRIVACNA